MKDTADQPLDVIALFDDCVQRTPDAKALQFNDSEMTYAELDHQAERLAQHLRQWGVGPEHIVGVSLNRSPLMVIALLGILKAGGAYLPLDPAYPVERLRWMIADSGIALVLTESQLQTVFVSLPIQLMALDGLNVFTESGLPSGQAEPRLIAPGQLAYVIYTSGSTGQPKGVLIEHAGLSNLVAAQIEAFPIHAQSRVLQFASLNFDASVSEIFTALAAGATLCLAPQPALLPGPDLLNTLRSLEITVVTLPPSVLAVLPAEGLPGLHTVVSAGEACSPAIVERWAGQDRRFINAYGPTEATVCATWQVLKPHQAATVIGGPIANTQVYIVDEHQACVADGESGELWIGGLGLARGYLNQPELTAEKFIVNPFVNVNGERLTQPGPGATTVRPLQPPRTARLYKTGDLVRRLADGTLEFIGRADRQLKHRGYRIEPGEIEARLSCYPGVSQALVIAQGEAHSHQRLVAYIVTTTRPQPTRLALRRFLSVTLPGYMIPAVFVTLDSFPMTANGKVDWGALPRLQTIRPHQETPYVAPRTPLEQHIAEIWADILKLDTLGSYDNFFDLGGHSLMATQIVSAIREQLQIELPLSILLSVAPTIAETAQAVEQYLIARAEQNEIETILNELEGLSDAEVQAQLSEYAID